MDVLSIIVFAVAALFVVGWIQEKKKELERNAVPTLTSLGIKDPQNLPKSPVIRIRCPRHGNKYFEHPLAHNVPSHSERTICPWCDQVIHIELISQPGSATTQAKLSAPDQHTTEIIKEVPVVPVVESTMGIACYSGTTIEDVSFTEQAFLGKTGLNYNWSIAPLSFRLGGPFAEIAEKRECPICHERLHFAIHATKVTLQNPGEVTLGTGAKQRQHPRHYISDWPPKSQS